MRRRITATLILTIVSLAVTTIIAAGSIVSADFDNASIYPLTITLNGGPQELNIVLGNTTTSRIQDNIDTHTVVEALDNPSAQTTGYANDLSMLSGATVTNTVTLSQEHGGIDDTFTQDIITNTTTLQSEEFFSGSTLPSTIIDTSSITTAIVSDKPAPQKAIATDTSTIATESIADEPMLYDESLIDDKSSTDDILNDEILSESELPDFTNTLSETGTSGTTSSQTQDAADTNALSEESGFLTTSTLAEFTTIDTATDTASVISSTETATVDNSASSSLFCDGLLAVMFFVSAIAAIILIISIIAIRR